MNCSIGTNGKTSTAKNAVAGGDAFSDSFTLAGQVATQVGFVINVTTPNAGAVRVTPQTAPADASDSDATQWLDCSESVYVNFSLAGANTLRVQVCDYVLDKVRLKFTGNSTAAGTLSIACFADVAIT